jgi:hypothetical protein
MAVGLILGSTAVIGEEQTFDHDSYLATSLEEIYASAPKITEGADLFFKKRQFVVKLEEPPAKCPDGWIRKVFQILGVAEPPPVTHCIKVASAEGRTAEIHVQDVLVDALREEIPVGGSLRIYAVYLYFNGHTQQAGFVMNEFEAVDTGE